MATRETTRARRGASRSRAKTDAQKADSRNDRNGRRRHPGRPAARDLGQRVLHQEPPPAGLRHPRQGAADHGQGGGGQQPRRLRGGRASCPTSRRGGDRAPQQPEPRKDRFPASIVRGQRPGHRHGADPQDLRQAALRIEVPPPQAESAASRASASRRPACTASSPPGKPVVITSPHRPHAGSPPVRDRARHAEERARGPGRRRHRLGGGPRHPGRDRAAGVATSAGSTRVDEYLEQTAIANPHADARSICAPRARRSRTTPGPPRSCRPNPRRSSPTPTASSWAS